MDDILAKITSQIASEEKAFFDAFDSVKVTLTRKDKPLQVLSDEFFLIAECKKGSPSKGIIVDDYAPVELAKKYEKAGASAISVLTEKNYFHGAKKHLSMVKSAVNIPVLRKDFIIHPYQVYEAYELGADIVLLIVACLDNDKLHELQELIISYGMTPLVEVHNEEELERALAINPTLVGINNRDLKTFKVDVETSFRLKKLIPDRIKVVSESGIKNNAVVKRLKDAGFFGALIGESILVSSDVRVKINELMGVRGIKICGITNKQDFDALSALGVDYLGFIFYEKSPRYVSSSKVAEFTNSRVTKVGVFVNETADRIREIYSQASLDVVQLHGEESVDFCESLGLPYWKAIRVKDEASLRIIDSFPKNTKFLLDSFVKDNHGGTGQSIAVELIKKALDKTKNIIVAGGIGTENIAEILTLPHLEVDVNSSVELSPGNKDVVKCSEVIAIAKGKKK
ncbi:MAG: indole-3-glycerol phosphate synthase TrpC [Candidatus Margulisbacteria bacterium]|nr:indole-3-glycerol phosphate synthase TrpC [Candidatus Margulisiibacteriota bacterium]